jgi:hypothetical protein
MTDEPKRHIGREAALVPQLVELLKPLNPNGRRRALMAAALLLEHDDLVPGLYAPVEEPEEPGLLLLAAVAKLCQAASRTIGYVEEDPDIQLDIRNALQDLGRHAAAVLAAIDEDAD